MCVCSPQHLRERYCGGKAGGSRTCRHPLTDSPARPLTVQPNGAQLEYYARMEDKPKPPIHESAAIVKGHLGFDYGQLDELVARLKGHAATALGNLDGVGTRHYLDLAHRAEHVGTLLRDIIERMHKPPPSVAMHKAGASPLGKGEPA
jgi:hypothetical protein